MCRRTCFIFVLTFLCLCIEVRLIKAGQPSGSGASFTNEEDAFIVRSLLFYSRGYTTVRTESVWNDIAKAHSAMVGRNTPGFAQERSAESIQSHYEDYLQRTLPSQDANGLDSLMQELSIKSNDNTQRQTGSKNSESSSQNQQVQDDDMSTDEPQTRNDDGMMIDEPQFPNDDGMMIDESQSPNMENEEEWIQGMLEELQNTPYDLDFSKM